LRPQHAGFVTGYEIKKNWPACRYCFILKSIAKFCLQPAQWYGWLPCRRNSHESVQLSVHCNQWLRHTRRSHKAKQQLIENKGTPPINVNTLTLELAKPLLSPPYDVTNTLFVCFKKLFCLTCCGSSILQLALSEQPSHVSVPKACLWLSDSYRMSHGN